MRSLWKIYPNVQTVEVTLGTHFRWIALLKQAINNSLIIQLNTRSSTLLLIAALDILLECRRLIVWNMDAIVDCGGFSMTEESKFPLVTKLFSASMKTAGSV